MSEYSQMQSDTYRNSHGALQASITGPCPTHGAMRLLTEATYRNQLCYVRTLHHAPYLGPSVTPLNRPPIYVIYIYIYNIPFIIC